MRNSSSIKRLCFFLHILAILYSLSGRNCSASSVDVIDSVKMYLMEQRYFSAERVICALLIENPRDIDALYLRSAVRQTKILDYESYSIDGDRYIGFADSTLHILSEALFLQKGKDSIDCLFYMASILGGIGVIKAKNGNWPGAIKNALSSIKYFKQVIYFDSTYYSGYYGIGVFNYYLSQQLKWLPFFGDKRRKGLQQLQKATRAAFPFNYGACNSLCWIYIDRQEFNQADSIASSVLSEYPDNTLFIRIKIRIDLASQRWNSAASLANKLIELSSKRDPINWPDIVSGYQALVCSYDRLNRFGESLNAANAALSLPIPDHYRKIPFVKKHLKFIERIRKKYTAQQGGMTNRQSFLMSPRVWHSADFQDF